MSSLPHVLICGKLVWAHDELKDLLGDLAHIIELDSPSRDDFLNQVKPGGKYANIVAIYRHNNSSTAIGVFDAPLVVALPQSVKWIAHNGAGYDQIDVLACKKRGITVSNTPGAVDDATATTALFLLLSALRHYSAAERSLRTGTWKPEIIPTLAHDPANRTIAILGLGGIGLRLAQYAHALDMRVIYHSRRPNPLAPEWAEYFGPERLYEMLGRADVLSVHIPLREDTVGFVGEKEIRTLKRGSVIINTARGKVIDEEAVIRALKDGHLGNVGLDVYPDEPHVNPRLLEFPQLALLPHMGTENQDAQRLMEVRALTNIRDFFTKGKGADVVPEMK